MMISSKGGPDGQPAMWESTIRGNLMNTRTTMSTVAWSVWRLAMLVGAIMLVTALPREVAAQSANATLRGKAPASSRGHGQEYRHGLHATHPGGERRYLRAGGPPAGHLPGRCRSRDPAERHAGRRLDGDPGFRRRGASDGRAAKRSWSQATRLNEVKTSEVGGSISLRQIEATPQITRNFLEFADAVPGMQFSVDAKGNTQIRSGTLNTGTTNVYIDGVGQKNYVRPSGVTGQAGADPDPRCWREPEYRRRSGQPVPAARHRRIQGHHVELQGRVRPGFGRRDHGGDQVRHQRVRGRRLLYLYGGGFPGRRRRPRRPRARASRAATARSTAFRWAGRSSRTACTSSSLTRPRISRRPIPCVRRMLFDADGNELDWVGGLTPELRENYGPVANPFDEDLFFAKLDWEITDSDRLELSAKSRAADPAGRRGRRVRRVRGIYLRQRRRSFRAALGARGRALLQRSDGHVRRHRRTRRRRTSNLPGRQFVALNTLEQRLRSDPAGRRRRSAQLLLHDAERLLRPGRHHVHRLQLARRPHDQDRRQVQGRRAGDARRLDGGALRVLRQSRSRRCRRRGGSLPGDSSARRLTPSIDTTSTSKNRQYGIYIQDDWVVNDHLTLNLGVRYDYEETPTYTDYVTPQRFVDAIFGLDTNGCAPAVQDDPALCLTTSAAAITGRNPARPTPTRWRTPASTSTTTSATATTAAIPSDQIAPRFGFSYDLNADQAHVIFGGAARSYDRNTFSILQHETNKATLYTPTVQFWNDNNPQWLLPAEHAEQPVLHPVGRRLPDAGGAGVDRAGQLRRDALHQQQPGCAVFRPVHPRHAQPAGRLEHERRIGVHHELRRRDRKQRATSSVTAPGTGTTRSTTRSMSAPIPNAGGGGLFLFDNAKATRTTQFLLSADKPYSSESRWSASLAYTYSDAKERLEFNGDYQFDYAFPYYSPYVLSGEVPKHRLVAIGNYRCALGHHAGRQVRGRVAETPVPVSAPSTETPLLRTASTTTTSRPRSFRTTTIGYFTLDLQADEVVRVRQWICHPVAPRRAQRHESRELRVQFINHDPGAAAVLHSKGTSRACRARSS